jgi:hypothetical protein
VTLAPRVSVAFEWLSVDHGRTAPFGLPSIVASDARVGEQGRDDAALRRAHRRRVQRAELDDAAWDGAMVAGWSASALGMLWPESDAACVVAGGNGGVLPAAARRLVVIIAAS